MHLVTKRLNWHFIDVNLNNNKAMKVMQTEDCFFFFFLHCLHLLIMCQSDSVKSLTVTWKQKLITRPSNSSNVV